MKSTNPAGGTRRTWPRAAGYGGAALLVAAAVVVLLMPLFDQGGGAGTASGRTSAPASQPAGQPGAPGTTGQTSVPTNPVPQQNQSGQPYPGRQSQQGGDQGAGPPPPAQGGDVGVTWCQEGLAVYRPVANGLEVTVNVSGNGAVKAEVVLKGRAPKVQQAAVKGRPHTFQFKGVSPALVQRVRITTMSVGASMDNCYARPGA